MPSYSMAPDNGRVNRVAKLIVNPDTGPIYCCWSDCGNRARSSYVMRMHEHPQSWPCEIGRHAFYTFCSARCGRYFALCMGWAAHETAARNHGLIYGMAAPGDKLGRYR